MFISLINKGGFLLFVELMVSAPGIDHPRDQKLSLEPPGQRTLSTENDGDLGENSPNRQN